MKLLAKCKFQQNCLFFYIVYFCRLPIQNIPIPLKFPPEHEKHIWGGEGIIQGFQKRDPQTRRVPHFWVPVLKRSVVYTEILNEYISVIVTDRAIKLINSNYGFDHYLLKVSNLKTLWKESNYFCFRHQHAT